MLSKCCRWHHLLKSALHRPSAKLWTSFLNHLTFHRKHWTSLLIKHQRNVPVHQQTLYDNMTAPAIWVTLRHGLPRSANDFLPGITVEPGPSHVAITTLARGHDRWRIGSHAIYFEANITSVILDDFVHHVRFPEPNSLPAKQKKPWLWILLDSLGSCRMQIQVRDNEASKEPQGQGSKQKEDTCGVFTLASSSHISTCIGSYLACTTSRILGKKWCVKSDTFQPAHEKNVSIAPICCCVQPGSHESWPSQGLRKGPTDIEFLYRSSTWSFSICKSVKQNIDSKSIRSSSGL